MKLPVLPAAALAVPLFVAPAPGQVLVSPLVVEASPSSITVANTGSQPLRLSVAPMDFDQDAAGRTRFDRLGSSPHSCAARLRVGEAPTQVAARGEIRIPVAVAAGERTCWSAVLIRVSTGFAAAGSIGVKVYAIPAAAPRAAEVSAIELVGDTIRVEVTNTGPTPLRPRGRVEVRTLQGATVATAEADAFDVHPGVRRSVSFPVDPRISPGPYVALAIFDVGARDLIAGEARIEVGARAAGRR